MNISIETLGKLVIAVLIAIAVLFFIISGISSQMGAYNQTSSSIIGNITGRIK